jgi:hypothetical protein
VVGAVCADGPHYKGGFRQARFAGVGCVASLSSLWPGRLESGSLLKKEELTADFVMPAGTAESHPRGRQ